jgi:hypothetical protein
MPQAVPLPLQTHSIFHLLHLALLIRLRVLSPLAFSTCHAICLPSLAANKQFAEGVIENLGYLFWCVLGGRTSVVSKMR